MPRVERSIVIQGDKGMAYDITKDMETFPEFMPDVNSVTVVERDDEGTMTEWDVKVVGRSFKWTERDVFDDAEQHVRFWLVKGDLKQFEGEWLFEAVDDGAKVTLIVEFDLGVPMLAGMLHPVLTQALKMNSDKMLQAIKDKVEAETTVETQP